MPGAGFEEKDCSLGEVLLGNLKWRGHFNATGLLPLPLAGEGWGEGQRNVTALAAVARETPHPDLCPETGAKKVSCV